MPSQPTDLEERDPRSALEIAQDLIHGERAAAYGPPGPNFQCIADFWSTYVRRKYGLPLVLEAEDIAWLMVLLKIARTATGKKKRDDVVDVCGYAGTVEMVREEKS